VDYLDFDITVTASNGRSVARLERSPFGAADTVFDLPFSDDDLERFIRTVGRARGGTRRFDLTQVEDNGAKEFGTRLFDAVFAGEVGSKFQRSIDEVERNHQGLRLRLRVDEQSSLYELPWEFLYSRSLGRFLVLSVDTPLVRFIDLPQRIAPLALVPPLRVLVVVPSPIDVPSVDSAGELARLEEATAQLQADRLLELHLLENATFAGLHHELRRRGGDAPVFHVLHFIGHGAFDRNTGQGSLIFQDGRGRARRVSGHDLGMILHDHSTLRLAILNACEGARSCRDDPLGGVAQSLVRQGIPAVVAMQFEVTDETAKIFADQFYSSLADGQPVDAATAEARRGILTSDNAVEWATPVLYLRSPDGDVFDLAERPEKPVVARVAAQRKSVVSDFVVGTPVSHPSSFFGRYHEVKRLLTKLRTPPLQNAAIVGPKRSGKTSLLRHLAALTTSGAGDLRPAQHQYVREGFERHRWIYADFQDPRLQTRRGFLRHLLSEIDARRYPEDVDLDAFFDLVSDRLTQPTVFLMDEVGVALNRLSHEFDDGFWDAMRSLASSEPGRNLAFVLATHAPPHELATVNACTSPFFNIIGYTATLGPFKDGEADELIASSPVPFPDDEAAWIKDRSGGWPLLLQILCSELLSAIQEGEVTPDWRARTLRQLAPHAHLLAEGVAR